MPRGQALGVTYQRPQTDRYNDPEAYLRARIGGRAAEEVVYGTKTTGAANDIEQATNLARNMVTRWGMSERLGMVQLASEQNPYLGAGYAGAKPFSEETARIVDAEAIGITLMFPTGSGGIENASNFLNRGLAPAIRRAGIRRIDVHSLRHAYASLMIEAGVNLKRLQILMGHSSFRVTMDTYAHLVPDVRDDAVNRLAEIVLSAPKLAAPNQSGSRGDFGHVR